MYSAWDLKLITVVICRSYSTFDVLLRFREIGDNFSQWDAGGRESFQEAMASSITTHCALLPESCSLLSGCDHFYSRYGVPQLSGCLQLIKMDL